MDHLPVFQLLMTADPVVKGVMLLLACAALICWVIACEKLTRIVAFSRQVSALERQDLSLDDGSSWLVSRMRGIADLEHGAIGETRSEVPPLSWTPEHLCFRSPRCRRNAPHTRLSSGGR